MLRLLFLGVVAASALASCKGSKSDAPSVAASTPAGRVVEITGNVEATRNGQTRVLAMGSEVFADDQVATSADGTVTIELFHNGARWAVVSNKQARVDGSLAWGLDKQQASKTVEHNSASAGRNAERSAADTGATAQEEKKEAPAEQDRAAEAAPAAAPTAAAPAPEPAVVPPPPPPPPPKPVAEPKRRRESGGGGPLPPGGTPKGGGSVGGSRDMLAGDEAPMKDMAPTKTKAASLDLLVAGKRDALKACLDPQRPKITITVTVAAGKPTIVLAGDGNITDKVRACAAGVIAKIDFGQQSGTTVVDFR